MWGIFTQFHKIVQIPVGLMAYYMYINMWNHCGKAKAKE